jgi:hypothetical protein
MVNPVEFLQINSTSILAAGGDKTVMPNYFSVVLIGMAQSWLMNLPEGSLTSCQELCHQFTANFESAYLRCNNSFIQRFSQVRNTIPRISYASIVVAFCQGVRDEKMLEKLTMHDIQDVTELFSLADKCTRAIEGHA